MLSLLKNLHKKYKEIEPYNLLLGIFGIVGGGFASIWAGFKALASPIVDVLGREFSFIVGATLIILFLVALFKGFLFFKFVYAKKIYESLKRQNVLDIIAKYNQITADYVYNPHYPKAKTQENQNNLKKDFDILLALKEVMLDNKLEGFLKDIRQRIAIIFYDAMSVEFDENELKKKRGCGAISNHEYNQEMPKLHNDFLKHKEIIINYLK